MKYLAIVLLMLLGCIELVIRGLLLIALTLVTLSLFLFMRDRDLDIKVLIEPVCFQVAKDLI